MAPKRFLGGALAKPPPPLAPALDAAACGAASASIGPRAWGGANWAPADFVRNSKAVAVAFVASGPGTVAAAPFDQMEKDTT